MSARTVLAIKPTSTDVVHIASCPVHGLHGCRTVCFAYEYEGATDCDGTVQQIAMVPVEIIEGGPCACGCNRPKRRNSDFHEDACRTRHWKERTGYVHPDSREARNARNGAQTRLLRTPRPGGRQVAFGVAVCVLAKYLVEASVIADETQAATVAAKVLERALPARQRKTRARTRGAS